MKENNIEMYSTYNEEKSFVAERFIKTLKTRFVTAAYDNCLWQIYDNMTAVLKNVFWCFR